MSSKNKQILQKKPENWKTFDYTHGVVHIDMKLRNDMKEHLASGLQIAKAMVEDFSKELERIDAEKGIVRTPQEKKEGKKGK